MEIEMKDRIKALRKAVRLSQAKFAARIAISKSYIAEVETGNKIMNERLIRLIITEFNVDDNWIRTGKGSMFREGVNIYVAEAMGMFQRLAPPLQESTVKFIEEMLKLNEHIKTPSE